MWLNIGLGILALLGYALMGFAVFGNKDEIDKMYVASSSTLIEFIFDIVFRTSPTTGKRILIFLIGAIVAAIFSLGAIYA